MRLGGQGVSTRPCRVTSVQSRHAMLIDKEAPMSWHDGLTGTALEIARTTNSPLRVMAGPGTGKSYAMKRRLMRLLEEGVPPKRILVVTFTRTAAGDLVPLALSYLRNNPSCVERGSFDHVLVEEYQDLNKAEQVLLDHLVERCQYAIFGDEDQSIFSFRWAHPEGITQFHVSRPGTA